MNLPTKIGIGIGVLGAMSITVGGAWLAFGGGKDAVPVRLGTVESDRLSEVVSAPGIVEPDLKVDISAEVSARIIELPFEEGVEVHQGDLVVKLDDRDLKARYDAVVARRDSDRSRLEGETLRIEGPRTNLANARQTLERQRKLFQSGDISRQALDDTEARVQDLDAGLAASEKNLVALRNQLSASEAEIERMAQELRRATIVSPIDGRLVRLNAEVGELVMVGTMNNAGTVILTIADLSRMSVVAQVAEADIARVKVGQEAEVHINAYRGRVFRGTVTEVALQRTRIASSFSQSGNEAGTFEVRVSLALSEGDLVLSGLTANVDILTVAADGLTVPAQAVVDRKLEDLPASLQADPNITAGERSARVVFRVVDGVAHAVPVQTGISNLTETIITAGLVAGDRVVTGPYKALESLKDGDAVVDDPNAGAAGGPPKEEGGMSVRVGGGGGRRGRR